MQARNPRPRLPHCLMSGAADAGFRWTELPQGGNSRALPGRHHGLTSPWPDMPAVGVTTCPEGWRVTTSTSRLSPAQTAKTMICSYAAASKVHRTNDKDSFLELLPDHQG